VSAEARPDRDERAILFCSRCGDVIDCCEFCDDPGCRAAMCYGCVHLALGEMVPQPHPHGG
jgi:hypothetical protein